MVTIGRWVELCLVMAAIGALSRPTPAQTIDVPLQLIDVNGTDRLAINVGINGSAPHLYLFDTGSSSFNAAATFGYTATVANTIAYQYESTGYIVNQVTVPSVTVYNPSGGNPVSLPPANYLVGSITEHLFYNCPQGDMCQYDPQTGDAIDPNWNTYLASGVAPLKGGFYGTFGAGDFVGQFPATSPTTGGMITAAVPGIPGQATSSGYIVSAVGANSDTTPPGNCSPCLIIGLTPSLRAQFTNFVHWNPTTGMGMPFPNSMANGSHEYGVTLTYTLSAPGLKPVTWSSPTLFDTGTGNLNLQTDADVSRFVDSNGNVNAGATLTITSASGGSTSLTVTAPGTEPNAFNATISSGVTSITGIAFFLSNSVMYDLQNQEIGFTSSFVTDAPIATPLAVTTGSGPLGLAGIISGSGGVDIGAGGLATVSGANTYTGPTVIEPGGMLFVAGPGSIAASSGVTANGLFDISRAWAGVPITSLSGAGTVALGGLLLIITNASGTFAGVIADGGIGGGVGGSLVIAGGTQALTGVNTYTGGTTITGGATLAINADAALGAAGAPLTFNDGTLLALGTIATARPVMVDNGGGTINANGFTVSLGGPLTVDGPLTLMGTVMLGANATIGGTLTIANGLFSANTSVTANALVVDGGATLRGIGVFNAQATIAGTLAPGNSPGTLTFTAPVTMLPGSATQFDIDGAGTGTGAGNYSRVMVTGAGNSFTAAGTLVPLLRGITGSATNAYTPPLGQSFVVVNAQGGVQGSYSGLTQPAGLAVGTRLDALYGATALALVVTPQSYGALALAGIAETPNQMAVGSALDAGRPAAGVAMTAAQAGLYAPLYQLPAGAIPVALESLAPTIDADAMMVWRDAWYLVGGAVGGAMETRRGGQPDSQEQIAEGPRGSTIWLTALGQFASVGSANGVSGYSGSTGGVVAGVDMPALPWLTAGGALAFTSPQVGTKNGQTFSGQALQVTAYASAHQGVFFADAQLGGLFFQDATQRPLPAYGAQANGQTGGTGVGGSIRTGAYLQVASWQVEPSVGLAGLGLSQGGFTETQGGAANLALASQGLTSIQSVLAARIERRFLVGETMALVPTARIGWAHEFADTVGTANASFAAAGSGAPFSVQSAPIGRDAALIGLGATLQTGGPVSLYLAYNGAFAQNANAQTLTGGISVKW